MYPSYEILIIENNSTEEATFSYYQELEAQGIRVLKYPKQGFNYSAINNFGVKEAKGEYLLFLNNDMEIITPDFMEKWCPICKDRRSGRSARSCITRTTRCSMRVSSSVSAVLRATPF